MVFVTLEKRLGQNRSSFLKKHFCMVYTLILGQILEDFFIQRQRSPRMVRLAGHGHSLPWTLP